MKSAIFVLALVLVLSSAVVGCGRKGPLEPPPGAPSAEDREAERPSAR